MTKIFFLLSFLSVFLEAQEPALTDKAFDILSQEIERSLKMEFEDYPKPYFLSLRISFIKERNLIFREGKKAQEAVQEYSAFAPEVRVGSYDFDESPDTWGSGAGAPFHWDIENTKMTRHYFWSAIDDEYKNSCALFLNKKAKRAAEGVPDYAAEDFSRQKPSHFFATARPQVGAAFLGELEKRLSRASRSLGGDPRVFRTLIQLNEKTFETYFVNSEGSRIFSRQKEALLSLSVYGKSLRGLPLQINRSFFVRDREALPSEDGLEEAVREIRESFFKLRTSQEARGAFGPCLMDSQASAQLMLAFASRLEGERQRDPQEPQTFRGKIGIRVLPDFLTIKDDPTLESFQGVSLVGYYNYDEEGVAPQPTILIESGILKSFLLSRRPVKGLPLQSNGHGRADSFRQAHARAGNLFVSSKKELSAADLKKALREEMRKKNLPLGIIIEGLESLRQESSRGSHQMFRGKPRLLYFIDQDGREELVHNAEIAGTPMNVMQSILATGSDYQVFNFVQDGTSGPLGVGVVSPSLLIGEVEVQKGADRPMRLPILQSPLEE